MLFFPGGNMSIWNVCMYIFFFLQFLPNRFHLLSFDRAFFPIGLKEEKNIQIEDY